MRTVQRRGRGSFGIPSARELQALAFLAREGGWRTPRDVKQAIAALSGVQVDESSTHTMLRVLQRLELVNYHVDVLVPKRVSMHSYHITNMGMEALRRALVHYRLLVEAATWGLRLEEKRDGDYR